MSNKRKSRRLLKFFVSIVVLGMIMFLLPVSNIFAVDGDSKWDCPKSDLTKGFTQDGGNGAVYFVKYDDFFDGTFPDDYDRTDCLLPCDPLEITEVLIKAGDNLIVYYPDDTVRVWTGSEGQEWDEQIPPGDITGCYDVDFNFTGSIATSVDVEQIGTDAGCPDISHVEFYYKCGDVPTTGTIELTKSGLIGADTVDFTLSSTNPVYSQLYTVSVATPTALWTNLAHGTYTLTETPDPNNTYKYTLTVTPAGPYDIGEGEGKSLLYELTADNEAKGKIILEKKGLLDGDSVDFTLTGPNSYSQTRTVTEGGTTTVEWKDLKHGQYTLTETPGSGNTHVYALLVAPAGPYNIGDGTDESLLYTINATNSEVKAYIKICKEVDEIITATEFHFKITDSNIADKLVTVNAGECSGLIGLPLGTYEVWETDIGYTVTIKVGGVVEVDKKTSPQSVTVVLDKDDIGKTITVDFNNDPGLGKIKLTKNGLKAGATAYFKLKSGTDYYNTSGIIDNSAAYQGEPVTSSSNEVLWSDMPWGTYTFEETIPAGYTFVGYKPGKTVTIDETNQAAIVAVIATNTKTKDGNGKKDGDGDGIEVLGIQELPFTGFNWIYYVIGMALIIAGGFTSISVTKLLRRKEQ